MERNENGQFSSPRSLGSLITAREYIPLSSIGASTDGVAELDQHVTEPTDQSAVSTQQPVQEPAVTVGQVPAGTVPQGVTTQPQTSDVDLNALFREAVQPFVQRIQSLEGELTPIRKQQAERADREFRESVQAKLDAGEWTAEQAFSQIQRREREMAAPVIKTLASQIQNTHKQALDNEQEFAKNILLNVAILEHGFPPEAREFLASSTPENFDQRIQMLKSWGVGKAPQVQQAQPVQDNPGQPIQQDGLTQAMLARQAIQQSGVLATVTDTGSALPEPPKRGEIGKYIQSRPYTYASQMGQS